MQRFILCVVLLTGIMYAGTITDLLLDEMGGASSDQLIPVLIKPVGRADMGYINSVASAMDAAGRREFAVSELKQFAENAQQPVLFALDGFSSGSVSEVRTSWISNTVGCWATVDVIRAVAARDDVAWIALNPDASHFFLIVNRNTYSA